LYLSDGRKENPHKTAMKEKNTVVKAVRMKSELANKIERMAQEENRNFSNMAETILLNALENGNKQRRGYSM
jgi:hypothetical protein